MLHFLSGHSLFPKTAEKGRWDGNADKSPKTDCEGQVKVLAHSFTTQNLHFLEGMVNLTP